VTIKYLESNEVFKSRKGTADKPTSFKNVSKDSKGIKKRSSRYQGGFSAAQARRSRSRWIIITIL